MVPSVSISFLSFLLPLPRRDGSGVSHIQSAHDRWNGIEGRSWEPELTIQEELPVLEAFIGIRNRLTALKMVSRPYLIVWNEV